MTETLTLRRPDDWHVHLRDGDMLAAVAGYTARQFARAIVMPNLSPPVTSVAAAESYRNRIRLAVPEGVDFTPLMTVYLTDDSDPDEIARGRSFISWLNDMAIGMDGTCTGEHGIGQGKKSYLVRELGPETLAVMAAIKKALDPDNIMNPGKILI